MIRGGPSPHCPPFPPPGPRGLDRCGPFPGGACGALPGRSLRPLGQRGQCALVGPFRMVFGGPAPFHLDGGDPLPLAAQRLALRGACPLAWPLAGGAFAPQRFRLGHLRRGDRFLRGHHRHGGPHYPARAQAPRLPRGPGRGLLGGGGHLGVSHPSLHRDDRLRGYGRGFRGPPLHGRGGSRASPGGPHDADPGGLGGPKERGDATPGAPRARLLGFASASFSSSCRFSS